MTALPDHDPVRDAVYAAIAADLETREEYRGLGVSASALGQACDRALWYALRWASRRAPVAPRIERIFARGREAEDRIVQDLRRAEMTVSEVDPRTGRQWRFAWAAGWVRGKADGIVTGVPGAPKAKHVLEVKCIKAADWRAILKHGLAKKKPEHWHQLHAGMVGLEIDRGLYVAENADTCEILTERVRLDPDAAVAQETRVLRLAAMHEAPPRIADDPASFACRFCDHAAVCHEGARPERTCRSCLHFTHRSDGNGECARWSEPRGWRAQASGCPTHLFVPALVAGEQIDTDLDAETVTYAMPDGSTWTDGATPHEETIR